MATLNVNGVYVLDKRLTNYSQFQGNDLMKDFIWSWAAPSMPVPQPAFQYNVWGRDHMQVIGNTLRAEGGVGAHVTFGFTTASGTADEYAIISDLPMAVEQFQDPGLNVEQAIPRFLEELENLDIEARFCNAVDDTATHNSGNNAVTLSGTDQWSDYTASDPLDDIETGREAVRADIGHYPNKGWMSPLVWSKLQYHPRVLNSLKYTGKTRASIEEFGSMIQIPDLRLATARKITSAYGATVVGADVWGKDFYMGYTAPSPSLLSIVIGWHASRPLEGYPSLRRAVETMYDEKRVIKSRRVRYAQKFNDVSMASGSTYLIKSAVA